MNKNATAIEAGVQLLRHRRTKIVATLGPQSRTEERIEAMVEAGVNVFRLNMSHGTREEHRLLHDRVRAVADRLAVRVAVFVDLGGPKIRVGRFGGGCAELAPGSAVTVTTRDVLGDSGLVPSAYPLLADDVQIGDRILLDDGHLELRVESVRGTEIGCRVVVGGVIGDKKGINLPRVRVSAPALTPKDLEDVRFAIDLGVDFVALSFVRRRNDVDRLRAVMDSFGAQLPIIAKIEKPEALDDIVAIVDASDAIMVARGDLGVELPPEAVPNIQEQLVDLARARKRPVIVATQMLESMMVSPRPTRAEVTDVANAVRSGADAVMLSGETAAGQYPVEAVRMMDLVVRQVEAYLYHHGAFATYDAYTPTASLELEPLAVDDAVAAAGARLSRDLAVAALVVLTRSGRSMAVMSSARPAAPLIAASSEAACLQWGCLLWGVLPGAVDDRMLACSSELVQDLAQSHNVELAGRPVLVIQGFSNDPSSNMPSITVVPTSSERTTWVEVTGRR